MIKIKQIGLVMPLLVALLAVFATTERVDAQAMQHSMDHATGVAVVNESPREVRVFAFSDDIEERVLLGWVGGEALQYFRVPDEARTRNGTYRIAVQPVTPLPQLGVDVTPHPMEVTPTLAPDPMETVRLVVDSQMVLTVRMIQH